jgi:hypothetical protein
LNKKSTVEVSREKLTDALRAFTDKELLRHLQSKSLTPLATEIATAELRSRGLELTGAEATGTEDDAPQGEQADLVTVSETWDLLQASVLRGRLEADGITAYVWSEPVGTPDASGGRARVQVERFQLEQAKAVMAASPARDGRWLFAQRISAARAHDADDCESIHAVPTWGDTG